MYVCSLKRISDGADKRSGPEVSLTTEKLKGLGRLRIACVQYRGYRMNESNEALDTQNGTETSVSQTVVGVRFRSCGKMYTFEVDDIDVAPGTKVVVDSEIGVSLGRIVTPKQIIKKTKEPLKKVLRIANEQDFETIRNNRSLEDEARKFCIEKVKSLNLPMKIVSTETTLDKKRLTFYFTADGRIDFRELVRDLAAKFKTRIEMRQIGVRDEVKLLGGFGCCGRQTCCSLFLTSFEPITIRMAKEQDLSINQSKLSGVCGRLMCCLGYEHREAPNGESVPSAEETVLPVSEETADSTLGVVDSGSIPEIHLKSGTEKTAKPDVPAEMKDKPPSPDERVQPERPSQEKRHFRRHFKKKKRHKAQGDSPEKRPPEKPAAGPAEGAQKPAPGSKGKPFNRRKKFWKKKQQ